jgi:hypothetical protein
MNIWIYLLSVIGSFHVIAILSVLITAILTFIYVITRDYDETVKGWGDLPLLLKRWIIGVVVFLLIAAAIPDRRAIVESYLLYHGAQMFESGDANKAVEEFTKRVDIVIGMLEKK